MEIEIGLKKILDASLRPSLKRVMEKWRESKDAFAWVSIAKAVDEARVSFQAVSDGAREKYGYDINSGKSGDMEEILGFLLEKYGRPEKGGRFSLEGIGEAALLDFRDELSKATKAVKEFKDEIGEVLKGPVKLNIQRKILVSEGSIRKEHITIDDCFLLEPFLDLSAVGFEAPKKVPKDGEEEEEE